MLLKHSKDADSGGRSAALTKRLSSESRRLGGIVLLCAVAMWPPMITGRILLGAPAMTMLLFGALTGFLNTAVGGRRVGAAAALVFVLVVPASVMAGGNALAGASLMALACVLVGAAGHWERLVKLAPTALVGMVFLVAAPAPVAQKLIGGPAESRYLFAILFATAVCAFWPVVILPRVMTIEAVPSDRQNSMVDTVRYASVLAVLVSCTTYWVLASRTSHGVWLPLTLIMVLQVTPGATRHRLFQRVYGTVGGAIAAAVIATFVHEQWAIGLVLIITLVGMFASLGREPYAVFAFFLTSLILIGVSASEPAIVASEQRVLDTVLGAAMALVAIVSSEFIARRFGQKGEPGRLDDGRLASGTG